MSSLIELQNQIDKLKLKVVETKRRDFEKVVIQIIADMQTYGITAADLAKAKKATTKRGSLQGRAKPSAKAKKVTSRAKSGLTPKFNGPNGEVWTGRGLTPRWLTALIAQGHKKEDFAVDIQPKLQ